MFLGLVALAVVVVEQLGADEPSRSVSASGDGDVLVLGFGQATPLAHSQPRPVDPGFDETAAPRSPSEPGDDASVHIVRPGDTLSSIALQHLGDPALADQLARLNGLANPDALREGQRIRLR